MTEVDTLPARTRLPVIDAVEASLQSALIEALNRRQAGAYLLEARLSGDGHERVGAWISLDAGAAGTVHIAPILAAGAMPVLTDGGGRPDAAAAAVALEAIEPLVAAIELTIGQPLRPVSVVPAAPVGDMTLRIDARDGAACVHQALLAIGPRTRIHPVASLPLHPSAMIDVAPAWVGRIAGPRVAPLRLQAVSPGDLLLLGTSGNVARFVPPGRTTTLVGRLDVESGGITVTDETDAAASLAQQRAVDDATDTVGQHAPPDHAGSSGPSTTAVDPSGILVATSVEFDGGGLTMERLAALGIGSVVSLPAVGGGVLPVRLLAAGTPIATGELVAVGEGYGVLITARIDRDMGEG